MITTINAEQLRQIPACEPGYKTFVAAHGEETVVLSQALESNGLTGMFWLLAKLDLSESQEKDLHLLACEYAEPSLGYFESKYADDKRPRLAIQAKRKWVNGEITDSELYAAARAADAAARAAFAAYAAARAADASAADAAADAADAAEAYAAAYAAAAYAAREKHNEMLKSVLLKWERQAETKR